MMVDPLMSVIWVAEAGGSLQVELVEISLSYILTFKPVFDSMDPIQKEKKKKKKNTIGLEQ